MHCGEILGIAGLVGSGRTELLRAIFGADRQRQRAGGQLAAAPPLYAAARAVAGLAMIPEDRKQHGLLLPQSIRFNATLGQPGELSGPLGWIDARAEARRPPDTAPDDRSECRSIEQPVEQLSGGNQQKVVMARWLMRDAGLLFDEPTRGIDAAAKATVYRLLRELAEQGKALLVVSSDLRELMDICHRIVVMSAGRKVADLSCGQWSHEKSWLRPSADT